MKPGTKPKPTYMKLIRGNPGGRPLNRREPLPREHVRAPRPTPEVAANPIAKKEWGRISKELMRLKLLTRLDITALEQYCIWYARFIEAQQMCRKSGDIVKTKNGNLIQNPYLAVARRSSEMIYRYMTEFGLTPSARTRIEVDNKTGDADPLFD